MNTEFSIFHGVCLHTNFRIFCFHGVLMYTEFNIILLLWIIYVHRIQNYPAFMEYVQNSTKTHFMEYEFTENTTLTSLNKG